MAVPNGSVVQVDELDKCIFDAVLFFRMVAVLLVITSEFFACVLRVRLRLLCMTVPAVKITSTKKNKYMYM